MSTVLSRLERARHKETPIGTDVGDRLYQSMMADVRQKALEEARIEVQAELATARAGVLTAQAGISKAQAEVSKVQGDTSKAEARREAAKVLQQSAEALSERLNLEITRLKAVARDDAEKVSKIKATSVAEISRLEDELKQVQMKYAALSVQIASKPAVKKGAKPATAYSPIPAFKVDPIRGQDGRIYSATVTPIGLN